MQALHFGGLPEHVQVGPARLLPCNKLSGLLQPCCVCRKLSAEYQLCDAGHSVCADCVPPSATAKKWCVCCVKFATFTAFSIPPNIVEKMMFACACEFTGTLSQMREHLLCTGSPETCFGASSGGKKRSRDERSASSVRVERRAEALQQDLSSMSRLLEGLELRTGELTDSLVEVQMMSNILSADRRVFLFKLNELVRAKFAEQHKIVAGVPLKLQLFVRGRRPDECLGVFVGTSQSHADICSWPLKKVIMVTLHNSQGKFLRTVRIPTFADGAVTHDTFLHPSCTTATYGHAKFLTLTDLAGLYAQSQKTEYLIFSINVEEISPKEEALADVKCATNCGKKASF